MDILSAAISSVRIGRAEACWVTKSGSWGLRYPTLDVSGFHILVRGSGWLITADGPPRALVPGDVVLTSSGAAHGLSHAPSRLEQLPPAVMGVDERNPAADVEFLCGAYWLDHGEIHPYLRTLPEVIAISPDYEHSPQLRSLTDLLGADLSDAGPGTRATRPALLDLMLTHILRQWLEQNRDAEWPATGDPAIATALREIHAGPDKPWTVQQLSETAGMSRTAFTRRFTELVGKPPRTYLITWRLTHAAHLLRESRAPLAAVARKVGYSTEFAFGAAFRREYGISPGRFRDLAHATESAEHGTAPRFTTRLPDVSGDL
ncbi:AraC family transcriptional regulator [Streptomyces tauricus]|uniref:AraC family transcriptional regulator n=1 Tax=Streptomyces tauricus TaxID=68274 RepID=UPI001679F57B|nr:AraC family transcriptional regulator [Streptomyces tauricus]GHA65205.1 AraC family transcriptional regulator [Streptomyces tauricus]